MDKKNYEDPYEKIAKRIDETITQKKRSPVRISDPQSVELQKVHDNLSYIQEIKNNPIKPGEYSHNVFGFETVDMSVIESNNIWDRSIFTTDKLCRMFLSWTVDQLLKYERKKRRMDSKMLWLLILLGGGGLAVFIIFLLIFGGG